MFASKMKMFLVLLLTEQLGGHAVRLKSNATPPVMCDIPVAERKSFTYAGRSWENYVHRWDAIRGELQTWASGHKGGHFNVVDVGSNRGFFSVQTARAFPQALVIGVEGSVGAGNGNQGASRKVAQKTLDKSAGVENHLKWIQNFDLLNNVIAPEVWGSKRVGQLLETGFTTDVMYLLSVFHWMDKYSREAGQYNHKSHNTEDTVDFMAKVLSLAQVHFIELPNFRRQRYFPQLKVSFHGSEELFLKAAVQKSGRAKTIKEIFSDNFVGVRRIFMIKDGYDLQTPSVNETLSYFEHIVPDHILSIPSDHAPACK